MKGRVRINTLVGWGLVLGVVLTGVGCAKTDTAPSNNSCSALTGKPWVPNVVSQNGDTATSSNHNDASVAIYKDVYTGTALLTGLDQTYSLAGAHVVTISGIDMSTDLLTGGSLSLVAQVTGFPAGLQGGAYPVLISLSDGTNEYIKMTGCDTNGFFTCSNGTCGSQVACTIQASPAASAWGGTTSAQRKEDWSQHQFAAENISVNTFPTCNWTGVASFPCGFTDGGLFVGGKLRSGVTYTAKYVLVADSYNSAIGDAYSAGLKLTVIRKKDGNAGAGSNGAIDLNVILVGNKTINASRTSKGKQNLDALFSNVYNHYYVENSGTTKIRLGKVTAYEWPCSSGGDAVANTDANDIGTLFATGSSLMPSSSEGKALNIFMVESIPYAGSGTLLGIAGAITGSMINGTPTSGLAFATFNQLSSFNPACTPGSSCPVSSQQSSFIDMSSTISHEMGHFLGLFHLSEKTGTQHDKVPDTPICTKNTGGGEITHSNCETDTNVDLATGQTCPAACTASIGQAYNASQSRFCPTVSACQFNHVMWWTSKNYGTGGTGDGNIFSTNSAAVINYNPFVQ